MVVYGCLWLHGCVMDVCIYIYMWVSGICPAPAPEGPERGDGRYVFVCAAV